MNNIIKGILTLPVAAAIAGCCNNKVDTQSLAAEDKSPVYNVEKAWSVPDFEKGYEQGVSAMYAATSNNTLYIAGGCNFPDTPAADGGNKVYYKGIYRISTNEPGGWQHIAELPEESAYGVCLQDSGRWIIAGGMNSKGATNKVYSIDLATMQKSPLPPLPCTIDNAAGTIAGSTIYIIGGNVDGKAGNKIFALNLEKDSSWEELTPMPSLPRVQPVCAAVGGTIYVWGGFSPATEEHGAHVHTDGIKYHIATGEWEKAGSIMAGTDEITLSGGTAVAINDSTLIATGGVDKDIFLDAISGRYNLVSKKDYMHQPAEWYKFNNRLMQFNCTDGQWKIISTNNNLARAGALLTAQQQTLFLICGELKPGIRTPEIFRIYKQ